ncbi:MAG TPA: glycine cleavage system protein GcvH [Pseudonocardiaceae bacterium]|jgi:glycine cleavage system H protein|nr:glycine cleavage system protein [Pseudonocardiales bacterium]
MGDDVEEPAVVPEDLRYTPQHEWVLAGAEGTVRIGITDYAQRQLGDVVYVQLPPVGNSVAPGEPVGEVESTKSVSDLFAPVAGEVIACNDALQDNPELVNSDPYGVGWMIEVQLAERSATDSLMNADDYRMLIEEDG